MKFSIGVEALDRIAGRARSLADRRPAEAILANILISVTGNTASFHASDLDREIEFTVPVEVEREGSTTVSVDILAQIARALPKNYLVELDYDAVKERVRVVSGQSRYALSTLPSVDFPAMSEYDFDAEFVIRAQVLRRLFEKSRFAVSHDESRQYLNGVYLNSKDSEQGAKLVAVGLDGYQMAVIEAEAPITAADFTGVIIPEKTVIEFSRMFDGTEDVTTSISKKKIQFKSSGTRFQSRLIDAGYPDYEKLIPTQNDLKMTVPAKQLVEAINRVVPVAAEVANCSIGLQLADSSLKLTVSSAGLSRARDEIMVTYDQNPYSVRFTHKSLMSVLDLMDDGTASFIMHSEGHAAVILDSNDANSTFVVMPSKT